MKAQSRNSPTTHDATATTARGNAEPLLFFKANKAYGEFFQWYPATLTVGKSEMSPIVGHPIDGGEPEVWNPIYFSYAEQFMMYCKAGTFRDTESQQQIMATGDPKQQKALARATRGFQASRWDEIKSAVVVAGNMAKFQQNAHLKSHFPSTGDRVLAEDASQDRVWGIGYTAEEVMAQQRNWGENRLGKGLMEVMKRLREELVAEQPDREYCVRPTAGVGDEATIVGDHAKDTMHP
ncbi:hypothetical protein PG990_014494 [Apiospora arundinis]